MESYLLDCTVRGNIHGSDCSDIRAEEAREAVCESGKRVMPDGMAWLKNRERHFVGGGNSE